MIKAKQVNKAINWIAGAAAVYFVGTAIAGAIKRKRTQGANGVGYADTPNYTLGLLNRYLSSHEIYDVQVVLNDKNKYGHHYVLCGDDQGGRDFYLAPKNIPYFKAYCMRKGIEWDAFYLPESALRGMGYSRSSSPEEERPILNLIYYSKDKNGHDVYVSRKGRFAQYIIDASNRFRSDESAVYDLYFSYPGYRVNPDEWDIYRDEHDWNWHAERDGWYLRAYTD